MNEDPITAAILADDFKGNVLEITCHVVRALFAGRGFMESNNSNQYHNIAKKQTDMRQRADFARNKERIGRLRKDNGRCNEKVSLK